MAAKKAERERVAKEKEEKELEEAKEAAAEEAIAAAKAAAELGGPELTEEGLRQHAQAARNAVSAGGMNTKTPIAPGTGPFSPSLGRTRQSVEEIMKCGGLYLETFPPFLTDMELPCEEGAAVGSGPMIIDGGNCSRMAARWFSIFPFMPYAVRRCVVIKNKDKYAW